MALPVPSGCFWDHLPPQRRTRFNLLLLEHGEIYFNDYAVVRYRIKGRTKVKVPGRLKVSSRSLVFDPVSDVSQPLLRFSYKHISNLLRYTPDVSESRDFEPPLDGLFIFSSSTVTEMKANDLVGPYVSKRCGDDFEGPDFIFKLQHTPLPDFLGLVERLLGISQRMLRSGGTAQTEETLLRPLLDERERQSTKFDLAHLNDIREKLILTDSVIVDRITPLIKNPGCLMVTDKRVYFQPAELNNVGLSTVSWPLAGIAQVFRRRYMLRQTGLELYLGANGGHDPSRVCTVFFSFRSSQERDRVYNLLMKQPELAGLKELKVAEVVRQWQERKITNLEYLSYLNSIADRSYNDLTQYPVFPWLVSDYTSKKLDLDNPATFRDLSKPIGALDAERLEYFRERLRTMPDEDKEHGLPPKFLYGTHYSTPAYVLFYLVRAAPEFMLCLQDGKFDAPDRMFVSLADTWRSCLHNTADLKELIPEFYCSQGEFLRNTDDLPLGTTQAGVRVHDVGLPPWAKSERDLVRKLKKALNDSKYASDHLHEWIDLIFGHKQQGDAAQKADNLFFYLTYEGAVDLEKVESPVERAAIEAQIREFGQTPKQVFNGPHPRRDDPPGTPLQLSPAFSAAPPASSPSSLPSSPLSNLPMHPRGVSFSLDPPQALGGGWEMVKPADTSSPLFPPAPPPGNEWEILRKDDLSLSLSSMGSISSAPSPSRLLAKSLGLRGPLAQTQGGSAFDLEAILARDFGANAAATKTPRSIRLDDEQRRLLEELYLQARSAQASTPTVRLTELLDESTLPGMVRLEDIAPSDELAALHSGLGAPPNPNPSSPTRNGGGLASPARPKTGRGMLAFVGSEPLVVHRNRVSCLKFAEHGSSLCSSSYDGSFRVSSLEVTPDVEGLGLFKASLRSKRHFSPSEFALSCVALTDPAMHNPMAVLGSWDNHLYLYSISSARQVQKLDAHDDMVSSLDVRGSVICTGSWDGGVKCWSLLPTGIEETPLVELFDKQVRAVQMDEAARLVAAGTDDGSVTIWDTRTKVPVSTFVGSEGGAAVTSLCWRAGSSQVYTSAKDGSLRLSNVDGGCVAGCRVDSDVRCIEVGRFAGEEVVIGGCGDASLRCWALDGGGIGERWAVSGAHEAALTAVTVDWENGIIATGSKNSFIRLWRPVNI